MQFFQALVCDRFSPLAISRVPPHDNRDRVFRGVVLNGGVQACDILQVWLDVAQHPSRAREQANLIWRKVLAAALVDRDENESGSERPIEALDRSLGQIV